jgi:hypothetical protein
VQYTTGALYHVMNHGVRREPNFKDRRRFVGIVAETCAKTVARRRQAGRLQMGCRHMFANRLKFYNSRD